MTATAAKPAARILALIACGMDAREAFNAVMGAGAYEKLAGEVFDAMRAAA